MGREIKTTSEYKNENKKVSPQQGVQIEGEATKIQGTNKMSSKQGGLKNGQKTENIEKKTKQKTDDVSKNISPSEKGNRIDTNHETEGSISLGKYKNASNVENEDADLQPGLHPQQPGEVTMDAEYDDDLDEYNVDYKYSELSPHQEYVDGVLRRRLLD